MFQRTSHMARNLTAAILRVTFIFIILLVCVDSMSRVYYSYMPVTNWINFKSVEVREVEGIATVFIEREPVGPQVAIFHRTLVISLPTNTRACTASVLAVLDNPVKDVIQVPLTTVLSPTCPEYLADKAVTARLQVSYIFDFPFGVKRMAVRYSNKFELSYVGDRYKVMPLQ